jgi:putative methionine-R-sulfoxide reductase with GAF domain
MPGSRGMRVAPFMTEAEPGSIKGNDMASQRTGGRAQTPAAGEARGFRFLAGITVVSTLGLVAAMLPVLESRVEAPWPWRPTQTLLLLAFPLTVAIAFVHQLQQQRRAARMQRELVQSREQEAARAQRQNARLAALLDVSRIMGEETSLQNVFDAVTATCRDAFECDQVTLMILDRDQPELVIRSACGGEQPQRLLGTRIAVGQGISGVVAERGTPVLLGRERPTNSEFPGWEQHERIPTAAMVVPIRVRDERVGVLNATSYAAGRTYDELDLQSLQVFAANVGTCIRHAEQAEWMRQLIQRQGAAGREPVAAR